MRVTINNTPIVGAAEQPQAQQEQQQTEVQEPQQPLVPSASANNNTASEEDNSTSSIENNTRSKNMPQTQAPTTVTVAAAATTRQEEEDQIHSNNNNNNNGTITQQAEAVAAVPLTPAPEPVAATATTVTNASQAKLMADIPSSEHLLDVQLRVKPIRVGKRDTCIILQYVNGPCPLIALANILLLKGAKLGDLNPDMGYISLEHLIQLLGNFILETNVRCFCCSISSFYRHFSNFLCLKIFIVE